MDRNKITALQNHYTAFQVMFKPIGPVCNLNCTYCYYLEKENIYKNTKNFIMSDEVLEKAIQQTIEHQNIPVISFVWQGGEPSMLGIDYFEKILKLQQKYAGKKKIENAFQTNGTLLNRQWCSFFKTHDFLVGISIDGPKHIHDKYRVTKSNAPTFDRVMESIEMLNHFGVKFNTLSVVHNENQDYPLEIYNFLKKIGSGFMQFIPIVERYANEPDKTDLALVSPDFKEAAQVTKWSVTPEKYGDFLIKIFDEWVRYDVGKYYVQHFDVALANKFGTMPGLCVFNDTCGDAPIIEHNGDIYTCDHFVYHQNYLGNIKENTLLNMVRSKKQTIFGMQKRNKMPQQCHHCEVNKYCHGGCPKNRIATAEDGTYGLNYLCNGYKKFFKHIDPYMEFMAKELRNERPPANVMDWIKQQQIEETQQIIKKKKEIKQKKETEIVQKVGRNDPCPCGSGKPYKKCCRNKKTK